SLPTIPIKTGVDKSTPTVVATMIQRCRSENPRIQPYVPSIIRQTKPLLVPCSGSSALRNLAQSMGVIVNEMNMLIKIENATTKPKLEKNRPTRPPMNTIGKKMTNSDSVVATTANAISLVAE